MTIANESRPGGGSGAASSVVATRDQGIGLTLDAATARLRNCYAVVVAGKTIRKHLYFNLPAAQRAVARAEARGATAHLVLVRLVPVDPRDLDTLEAVVDDAR